MDTQSGTVLLERTIEQLDDLTSLISYVEDKLESYSKIQIILLGLSTDNWATGIKDEVKTDAYVKTELESDSDESEEPQDFMGHPVDDDELDKDDEEYHPKTDIKIKEPNGENVTVWRKRSSYIKKSKKKKDVTKVRKKVKKKEGEEKAGKMRKERVKKEGVPMKIKIKKVKEELPTEIICEDCGEHVEGILNIKKHKAKHYARMKKDNQCKICNEIMYCTASQFKIHRDKCEADAATSNDFVCPTCGKDFPTSSYLVKHHYVCSGRDRARKPTTKTHVCQHCGKSYFTAQHLRGHVSSIHSNERPHVCATCGKSFARKEKLTEHQEIHSGVLRHKCHWCDKAYNNNGSKWNHMRSCSFNPNKQ